MNLETRLSPITHARWLPRLYDTSNLKKHRIVITVDGKNASNGRQGVVGTEGRNVEGRVLVAIHDENISRKRSMSTISFPHTTTPPPPAPVILQLGAIS